MTESEKRAKLWLEVRGWQVNSTGWPDFLCVDGEGRLAAFEVKSSAHEQTQQQIMVADLLMKHGIPVKVLRVNGQITVQDSDNPNSIQGHLPNPDDYLTTKQAMEMLGVDHAALLKAIQHWGLKRIIVCRKHFFLRSQVEQCIPLIETARKWGHKMLDDVRYGGLHDLIAALMNREEVNGPTPSLSQSPSAPMAETLSAPA